MKFGRLAFSLLLVLTLGTVGCFKGDTGPTGPKGPAGPSQMIGFVSIDAANGVAYNFGGSKTTAVSINKIGAGNFEITFTGTFTGVTGVADITVLGSVNAANTYSSHINVHMDGASAAANATTIVVPLNEQFSGSDTDMDFSLVILTSK